MSDVPHHLLCNGFVRLILDACALYDLHATSSSARTQMPGALRLEEEAPNLAEMSLADIEMPGNYASLVGGAEPPPGLLGPLGGPGSPGDPGVVMLESIGSAVSIVRRQGNGHRRLALHGTDGRVRYVILQQNVNWPQVR